MATVQLDAVGPQDAYLLGGKSFFDPPSPPGLGSFDEMTLRTAEDRFVGVAAGGRSSLVLDKSGDLAAFSDAILEIDLPAAAALGPKRWRPRAGLLFVKHVRLWAGDQLLDSTSGGSLRVLDAAFCSEKSSEPDDAASTATARTVRASLRLLGRGPGRRGATRNSTVWFPLAAAWRTELRLEIEWAAWSDVAVLDGTESAVEAAWFAAPPAARVLTPKVFFDDASMGTRATMRSEHVLLVESVTELVADAFVEAAGGASVTRVPAPRVTVQLQSLNELVKCIFFGAYDRAGTPMHGVIQRATLAIGSRELFDLQTFDSFAGYNAWKRGVRADPLALPLGLHAFALDVSRPEVPCGHLNFSQLARPTLKATLAPGHAAETVRAYALLHRFVRIVEGRVDVVLEP